MLILFFLVFILSVVYFYSTDNETLSKRIKNIAFDKNISTLNYQTKRSIKKNKGNSDTLFLNDTFLLYNIKEKLEKKLKQARLNISAKNFLIYSFLFGFFVVIFSFLLGLPFYLIFINFFIVSIGLPNYFLNYLCKRKLKKFLQEFPVALETIVRSVKTGLPLNDALNLIATDSLEPLRSEFQNVVDMQKLGLSLADSVMIMRETLPCSEIIFFTAILQIQTKVGGNLSESLSNLAFILRSRKKMKDKISALSMEAKASAYILGCMPFVLTLLILFINPAFIMLLFQTDVGNKILYVSGVWMLLGVLSMKKMINFEV